MKIRNRNTILDIPTDESGSIQTNNTDIFVTGGTFSASTISFNNNNGGGFNVTGISLTGATVDFVADETSRDSSYPSPSNNFQVYNLRIKDFETYSTQYGLWISSGKFIAVEDTSIQTIDVRHLVFLTSSATTVSGVEYPIANYVSSSTERNVTAGVVVEKGNTISGTSSYISIAHSGEYYIDYSTAITIGNNVYSTTNTSGEAVSGNFAQAGTVGQAIQNSGSDPSFPNSVLVVLKQVR